MGVSQSINDPYVRNIINNDKYSGNINSYKFNYEYPISPYFYKIWNNEYYNGSNRKKKYDTENFNNKFLSKKNIWGNY